MINGKQVSKSDEWYTPKYIFDSFGSDLRFDMDVAAPWITSKTHTPTSCFISENSIETEWRGFVWMNPPFGGRNGIIPWLNKIYTHGNGIALTPDRTSAPWWQKAAKQADAILFINGKVKFINEKGETGDQPANGTCLFAYGYKAKKALIQAEVNGLGILMIKRY